MFFVLFIFKHDESFWGNEMFDAKIHSLGRWEGQTAGRFFRPCIFLSHDHVEVEEGGKFMMDAVV